MQKVALGADIGGTSVKVGVVDLRGRLLQKDSFPTDKSGSRSKMLSELSTHLRRLARPYGRRVAGAGIGAPGPIDVERGFVYTFPNIPGWKNTPIRSLMEKRLGMPVRVDNDANAMALAESLYGAGRGGRCVLALTLGTGVGGGIVLDGKLFHGPVYSAAEIGHMVLNEDGPRCGCGNRGCLETYVGNGYFTREVKRRLEAGEKSVLKAWIGKEKRPLTPLLVAQAARRGDRFAREQWRRAGEHLGNALTGLVNILNPDRVILGGGIAQNGRMLFDPVIRTVRRRAFPIAARSARILPARLGADAGLVGAASLVLCEHLRKGSR